MITLIVARARNGAIGRAGTMPWHLAEDLAFFKRETLGGALIMGRTTWHSLPVRPLPSRVNIVVSSQSDLAEIVVPSITDAIARARGEGCQRLYGAGGACIYAEMMPLADRLLITDVALDVPDADTFFPAIDPGDWQQIDARSLRADTPACTLREYIRRRA